MNLYEKLRKLGIDAGNNEDTSDHNEKNLTQDKGKLTMPPEKQKTLPQLVSDDIMYLLKDMRGSILSCAGSVHPRTDNENYTPRESVAYPVSGIPNSTRGESVMSTPYEQRTLYIKADQKRWSRTIVLHPGNFLYTNKKKSERQLAYQF
ncbi:MAG: hypothetical protein P0S93_04085 [Candidatus Neptunochlamydia sp.]|nr:hypothetical protein [Candidatus Neptunochlamydia sp.]